MDAFFQGLMSDPVIRSPPPGDLSHWDIGALATCALARPEPLLGPVEPASAIGRAWCLTAVDTLVEQSSVVPWWNRHEKTRVW